MLRRACGVPHFPRTKWRSARSTRSLLGWCDDTRGDWAGPIRTGTRSTETGTLLSFDELLVQARRLLDDADLAALLPEAYPLVIVDEFQDTSSRLLDFLRAGFVGRATIRCFGDSHQRIHPESIDFDPHLASLTFGAEEHNVEPIPGFCRYDTHDIAILAESFRAGQRYRGNSALVRFESVPSQNEQLAHAIHWDALGSIRARRTVAIICFGNSVVGTIADLLATTTEKRQRLPVRMVTSKSVMAAQYGLYVALLRHWFASSADTERAIVEALALLTVGGNPDHKRCAGRMRRLTKAWEDGELPAFPVRIPTGFRGSPILSRVSAP